MTSQRTASPGRPARPERPPPDRLADAVRAITRQAVADGQPLATPDAQGLVRFLRHLGLKSPELSPAAPVVGRLVAELLVLEAQSPTDLKTADAASAGRSAVPLNTPTS